MGKPKVLGQKTKSQLSIWEIESTASIYGCQWCIIMRLEDELCLDPAIIWTNVLCVYMCGANTKVDTCWLRNTHGMHDVVPSYERPEKKLTQFQVTWASSSLSNQCPLIGVSSWLSWSTVPMRLCSIHRLASMFIHDFFFASHRVVDSKLGFNACWPNIWCLNKFTFLHAIKYGCPRDRGRQHAANNNHDSKNISQF